jgi:hypothetical protein
MILEIQYYQSQTLSYKNKNDKLNITEMLKIHQQNKNMSN